MNHTVYIADQRKTTVDNVQIIHSPLKINRRFPKSSALQSIIQTIRREIKRTANTFDGTLLELTKVEHVNHQINLHCCDIPFSTYKGLQKLYDQKDLSTITRTVSLIALTVTADDYVVLGYRNTVHIPASYLPPAGFTDHIKRVNKNYLRELTIQEIHEETGAWLDLHTPIEYLGLTAGTDSRNITAITKTKLDIDARTLQEKFEASNRRLQARFGHLEHTHLIYVPNTQPRIEEFISGRYTGTLNRWNEIKFKNGKCTKGPREIYNKKYTQISNGVGALLLEARIQIDDANKINTAYKIEEMNLSNVGINVKNII